MAFGDDRRSYLTEFGVKMVGLKFISLCISSTSLGSQDFFYNPLNWITGKYEVIVDAKKRFQSQRTEILLRYDGDSVQKTGSWQVCI